MNVTNVNLPFEAFKLFLQGWMDDEICSELKVEQSDIDLWRREYDWEKRTVDIQRELIERYSLEYLQLIVSERMTAVKEAIKDAKMIRSEVRKTVNHRRKYKIKVQPKTVESWSRSLKTASSILSEALNMKNQDLNEPVTTESKALIQHNLRARPIKKLSKSEVTIDSIPE